MPQRSPVIYWLLLAATLSVDAVAVYWMHAAKSGPGELYSLVLFYSLITSQLSVVAIWCVFAAPRSIASLLVPVVAVVAAAFLSRDEVANLADYATWFGTHTLVLLLVLWQLRRTSIWHRLYREPIRQPWRFSLAHIVILMTVVAVLLVFGRYTNILAELSLVFLLPSMLADIVLAVVATLIFATSLTIFARLAAIAAVAIAIGGLAVLLQRWIEPMAMDSGIVPGYLIQAFILAIWLEQGGILPREQPTGDEAKKPLPRA